MNENRTHKYPRVFHKEEIPLDSLETLDPHFPPGGRFKMHVEAVPGPLYTTDANPEGNKGCVMRVATIIDRISETIEEEAATELGRSTICILTTSHDTREVQQFEDALISALPNKVVVKAIDYNQSQGRWINPERIMRLKHVPGGADVVLCNGFYFSDTVKFRHIVLVGVGSEINVNAPLQYLPGDFMSMVVRYTAWNEEHNPEREQRAVADVVTVLLSASQKELDAVNLHNWHTFYKGYTPRTLHILFNKTCEKLRVFGESTIGHIAGQKDKRLKPLLEPMPSKQKGKKGKKAENQPSEDVQHLPDPLEGPSRGRMRQASSVSSGSESSKKRPRSLSQLRSSQSPPSKDLKQATGAHSRQFPDPPYMPQAPSNAPSPPVYIPSPVTGTRQEEREAARRLRHEQSGHQEQGILPNLFPPPEQTLTQSFDLNDIFGTGPNAPPAPPLDKYMKEGNSQVFLKMPHDLPMEVRKNVQYMVSIKDIHRIPQARFTKPDPPEFNKQHLRMSAAFARAVCVQAASREFHSNRRLRTERDDAKLKCTELEDDLERL